MPTWPVARSAASDRAARRAVWVSRAATATTRSGADAPPIPSRWVPRNSTIPFRSPPVNILVRSRPSRPSTARAATQAKGRRPPVGGAVGSGAADRFDDIRSGPATSSNRDVAGSAVRPSRTQDRQASGANSSVSTDVIERFRLALRHQRRPAHRGLRAGARPGVGRHPPDAADPRHHRRRRLRPGRVRDLIRPAAGMP